MKTALFGALALSLIATTSLAGEVATSVGYKDSGVYVVSAAVKENVAPWLVGDITTIVERKDRDYFLTKKLELGGTFLYGHRVAVRTATGYNWGQSNRFAYYSVSPSYSFPVPYTNSFAITGRYRDSFDSTPYQTYGIGAKAGWNVRNFKVTVAGMYNTGQLHYNEYTVGLSHSF